MEQSGFHQYGGDWTDKKLKVIKKYLCAYTKALKNQPFRKAYIDAFAGTRYRHHRCWNKANRGQTEQESLFQNIPGEGPQGLLDGSARQALAVEPRFDAYIFIEQSAKRCADLRKLKKEFPKRADSIFIQRGNANQKIKQLCANPSAWRMRRAVLFLDPYGMQVEWTTIEAIARTKAIDLWLLFPLGAAVNRMLTKDGNIPEAWRRRLNSLLGTTDWRQRLYRTDATQYDIHGNEQEILQKSSMETIGRFFNDRLKTVFAGVADNPGVLRNSTKCPLYLLCFAVGNKRATEPAMRIANHLLQDLL